MNIFIIMILSGPYYNPSLWPSMAHTHWGVFVRPGVPPRWGVFVRPVAPAGVCVCGPVGVASL